MRRSLLLASLLRREAEVSFAVRPRGKTLAFLIDGGFPHFLLDEGLPSADLYLVDLPRWEGELPGESLFVDVEGREGIKTLPPEEGGKFQVLFPRFRHFHLLEKEIREKGKKVLVALSTRCGPEEVEAAVERVLEEDLFPVLAPHFELSRPWLASLRKKHPRVRLVGPVQDLARVMWKADMALISGFLKPFEAASVGTPAVYWKEDRVSRSFENQGVGKIYRPGILRELYQRVGERREVSRRARGLVDALGLYRTYEFIRGLL